MVISGGSAQEDSLAYVTILWRLPQRVRYSVGNTLTVTLARLGA